MGILTNIIAAEEDEIEAIGESLHPLDEWSGIERRGIDIAKMAVLHCLLTGDDYDYALNLYEPVYINEEGVLVLRVADDVLEKLADMDEEALEQVALELAATEAYELEGWGVNEVEDLMFSLAELAQLAESQDQTLFVWMHPLMT